jgi:hypothetical protein
VIIWRIAGSPESRCGSAVPRKLRGEPGQKGLLVADVLVWVMQWRVVLADRAERLRKELGEIDAEAARLEAAEVVIGQFIEAKPSGRADDPAEAKELERVTTTPGAGGTLLVPRREPGVDESALPADYQTIMQIVAAASDSVPAKDVSFRLGRDAGGCADRGGGRGHRPCSAVCATFVGGFGTATRERPGSTEHSRTRQRSAPDRVNAGQRPIWLVWRVKDSNLGRHQPTETPWARTKSTLGALLDRWLPQHEVDPTTRMNYESQIRNYIQLSVTPKAVASCIQRVRAKYAAVGRPASTTAVVEMK